MRDTCVCSVVGRASISALLIGLINSCSPSKEDARRIDNVGASHEATNKLSLVAIKQNPNILVTSNNSGLHSSFDTVSDQIRVRLATGMPLIESRVNSIVQIATNDMLEKNREASKAVAEAKGQWDQLTIDEKDREAIGELVLNIKGFVPSSFGGLVFKFTRFTLVLVPGTVTNSNFNVYLIRIPNAKWMVLETKEM